MLRYTLLLAVSLLLISSASSQPARLNVSVQGGVIRNFQHEDWKQSRYTFYPEVQIASQPFSITRGISLQGGLRWGYWDDGVREHKGDISFVTYSHSSHIAGVRFYVVSTHIPLVSLSLFSGLSSHFVSGDYVGGSDLCISIHIPACELFDPSTPPPDIYPYSVGGYWGRNYHERFRTLEVGLRVAVPLGNRLAVNTEVQKYIHRSIVERISHTKNRFVYKLGLSFGFF